MKSVLFNYLCLHDVRQGYLTVLRNIYNEYINNPPPFKIYILIQRYPFEKYFEINEKVNNIDFIVIDNVRGKIKRGLYEQFLVPYWALKKKVDAIYMPATFALFFNVKPILLFFHVSVSFILPQKYLARSKFQANIHNFIIKYTTPKCDLIHCTTEQTKNELLTYIKYDQSKVSVNYNGIIPRDKVLKDNSHAKIKIEGRFILSVSQFYRLKNQDSVISSFINLKNKYPEFADLKLVLVGAIQERDYFDELLELSIDYKHDILFFHNISDADLDYLYTNCYLYVFLSIFEGFGLTPFEALFYNKPILLSNIPTLIEIYNGYASFVDPYDMDIISTEIKHMLEGNNNTNYDLDFIYNKFSWYKFVKKLNTDLLLIINRNS